MPVAVFSTPFGIAFGAAAIEAGISPEKAIAMSALVFSGAAQFATLDFAGPDVAWASLALIVLAISARLVVMGAVVSRELNALPARHRFPALAWLSDPNFARTHPKFRNGETDVGLLLGGGLALWLNWVAGTAIGALAGDVIGNVSRYGFDVVMLCFFAAVLAGEVRRPRMALPVAVAGLCAVATQGLLPAGWSVIVSALAGAGLSLVGRD
ncbi:MAG: hypothetical protein HC844_01685 [Tabrizicola sp.]|nr:hypothetical protein [Tabrizicola sp.]